MLQLSGSSYGGVGGDGGELSAIARGSLRIVGQYAGIRANAGPTFSGSGGFISLESEDGAPLALGPLDGDLTIDGDIIAQSGSAGGWGGIVSFSAGRGLTLNASVDVSGAYGGGDVEATAGGHIMAAGAVNAQARGASGDPGYVDFGAGYASDANLTAQRDLLAAGGSSNAGRQSITLRGCGLTVRAGAKIDGHAGMSGGSDIALIARRPMSLDSNTQFLAYPAGTIITIHPSGQAPSIGSGVTFSPARIDVVDANARYPACPP